MFAPGYPFPVLIGMEYRHMKLRHPEKTLFNVTRLIPLPVFLLSLIVSIDLLMRFFAGGADGLKVAVSFVLMIYLGARSWFGVRQAIDFGT